MSGADATDAITTRLADERDRPFILNCFLHAMRPSLEAWRGHWDEPRERARFDGMLDIERTTIVDVNEVDVGFVMLVESPVILQLHTIAIAPEHQHRGIGSDIVRDVINMGRQTNREVTLSVLRVNEDALRFYERLGFSVVEEAGEFRHMRFTA